MLESINRVVPDIRENVKDCLNESGEVNATKLFEKFFKKQPKGKIEVEIYPIDICFRIYDVDDYIRAALGEEDLANFRAYRDKKRFQKELGSAIFFEAIPALRHNIILLNFSASQFGDDSPDYNKVLVQEQQHTFNAMFRDAFDPETTVRRNVSGEEVEIERRIKDEISAYFMEGISPEKIRHHLLREDTKAYSYGKAYKNQGGSNFHTDYIKIVEDGILAYDHLLRKGCTPSLVHMLLYNEPLWKWIKVVERLTGEKKNFIENKNAREALREHQEEI